MLRRVGPSSRWTCSQCLRLQRLQRHHSTTAAPARPKHHLARLPSHLFARRASTDTVTDDRTLRQIFDSPAVWKEFSDRSRHQLTGTSAGLFQNRWLTTPEGWGGFASTTLQKCQAAVTKILSARTVEEYKELARDFDRLSDLLCRVIDLADFVRSTHPDPRVQAAATHAYASMFQYMNVLNTTTELNEQLTRASKIPEVWEAWSEEERTVAGILMRDFSKSAIDLPDQARRKFVELADEISAVGQEFVDNIGPEKPYVSFESSRMRGLDPVLARRLTRWGRLTLPTVGAPASMALRYVEDPDVRREIYMANRTASKANIRRLEQLLHKRYELAKLAGYDTFAHMALSDKMAKTPEAVNQFLQAVIADNHHHVEANLQELIKLKRADARGDNFPDTINAWDKDYYTARLMSQLQSKIRSSDTLSAYFSLGTVMQGLSRLYNRLYGIRLVPQATLPGETWNNDVRRLDVIDEVEGRIAVVYCDLFQRAGKNPHPSHFTIRCSREISPAEIEESATLAHPFPTDLAAATDGMAVRLDPASGRYQQLPTIALICDFARPAASAARPALLTFREVQTVFHEMGHALHSILGRTTLQNVSGTRCATDFSELPSILMEFFAADPAVLALYARHWETDEPVPMAALASRLAVDRHLAAQETESQILLAMLDQAYHSALPGTGPAFDSTAVYHDIFARHSLVPEPAGTAWQGFFGHLFGYGATYYSYLFDRAIAGKVWKEVFGAGTRSTDREAGGRWREEVLRWGGGRDGWRCVAGVLGDERLGDGGEEAMKVVGTWGVKE